MLPGDALYCETPPGRLFLKRLRADGAIRKGKSCRYGQAERRGWRDLFSGDHWRAFRFPHKAGSSPKPL